MLKIETIKSTESKMRGVIEAMASRLEMLNNGIAKVRADTTRSPQFINERLDELYNGCLSFFQNSLKELEESGRQLQTQRQFYENKAFMLGQQPFADDPQTDALMRQRWAHELSKATAVMLELHVKEAKYDSNLPKLHACLLENRTEIDLEDVVIPDMDDALALIENAGRLVAKGAVYAGSASRTGLTSVQKMNLGRAA